MEIIDVRPMKKDDVPYIMNIESTSFKAPWTSQNIIDEFSNPFSNLLVATIDNQIVGFVVYWITFNSATVCQIAVLESVRQRGIGSCLIEEVVNDCYAKRVQNITLEVRKSNEIAQKFYAKHGFLLNHEVPNYYSNGENALYMIRSIDING